MATFVEEIQRVGDAEQLRRRLADRIDALGEAIDLLESWTEASRDTRTELSSAYEATKRRARDEVDAETGGVDPADLAAEELLDHPAVRDRTKRRLREYSTKLSVYLDEQASYGAARSALLDGLGAELDLYGQLFAELESGEASVADARHRIARFAREDAAGSPNRTAADVVLESQVDAP